MDWIYASLIVGCLAYVGAIIIEYAKHRTGITPRIKQVEDEAIGVGLNLASEEEAAEHIWTRINRLQMEVDEMCRQKTTTYGRLVAERERKQRFEIAVFRRRLKAKQPLVSA